MSAAKMQSVSTDRLDSGK